MKYFNELLNEKDMDVADKDKLGYRGREKRESFNNTGNTRDNKQTEKL